MKTEPKKSIKKEPREPVIFENNSAFRRAMVQMGVKPGDKIIVAYSDGSSYKVERA